MPLIESHIAGSEKLTAIHGRWPTFHDAEIIDLHLSRGDILQGGSTAASLTAKILVCTGNSGTKPAMATLLFEDVENLSLKGFNHQNAIYSLDIVPQERNAANGIPLPLQFLVTFPAAHGMSAIFHCARIVVLDALGI